MERKKPLKRSKIAKKIKSPEQIEQERQEGVKMKLFFLEIWRKRVGGGVGRSEISGEKLYAPRTTMFHHIIPKHKCEEGRYDEENIIILTEDEHVRVEADMYYFPKINEIRNKLKEKYAKQGET